MRSKLASAEAAIARIAAVQHGVVTTAQLAAAGLDRAAIARRAQAGRLHRVHRGVYAVGHPGLSIEGRWMAAVLACGQDAVLSHRPAAALWRLLPATSGPVDVSVPKDGGRRGRWAIHIHRCPSLVPRETTACRGIPVTTPARTISDLRRALPSRQLRRAIREAAVLGLDAGEGIELEATRSELEEAFLRLCRSHRLPRPETNVEVAGYLVDFLWRERLLIAETDGYRYHRGRQAFEDDRARDAALQARGFRVLRFTYRQVSEGPGAVAAALRALL